MNLRSFIDKFVQVDPPTRTTGSGAPGVQSVVDIVRLSPPPPATPAAASFDLSDLYRKGGLAVVGLTAEQALGIAATVPAGLSEELRRQAFKQLLANRARELGVPPEIVFEDARGKIAVLEGAVKSIPSSSEEFVATLETELARLEEQIRDRRAAIEQAKEQQREAGEKCNGELERLRGLLRLQAD